MAPSARLLTSVPPLERERFTALAAERGVSVSHLLARLVRKEIAEGPAARVERLTKAAQADKAPAEKYTVRLLGADAAHLESRAHARGVTPSGYVAQLLRAHLRASPPMPYQEFEQLKRVTSELGAIRLLLQEHTHPRVPGEVMEASLRENILKLLPALKQIRDRVQDTLTANARSWEAPGG